MAQGFCGPRSEVLFVFRKDGGHGLSENQSGGRRVHIPGTVVISVVVAYRLLQTKPDLAQEASLDARQ
jgi:hypothetical protein